MIINHDSRNLKYRFPFGAVETGTEITLAVDITDADVVEGILEYRRDEESDYHQIQMTEVTAADDAFAIDQNPEGQDRGREAEELDETSASHRLTASEASVSHRLAASVKAPEDSCLLWYRFRLILKDENGIHSVYYCNNKDSLGGTGRTVDSGSDDLIPYQITVYKMSETPAWFKEGIVYQIFPDRFDRDEDWYDRCEKANKRVNDRRLDMQRIIETDWYRPAYYVRDSAKRVVKWPMYGGSLRGIRNRLDYLKSLGVTVIYLNPIFEASTNHRYDTGNYMKIDPALGTEQDFVDLAEEARSRGIRLILDGVFSHTGCDSIYFDKYGNYPKDDSSTCGAWEHEDSPFRSWYKFDPDEKWGYKSWWGVEDLPEVIEEEPDYQRYILGSKAAEAEGSSAAAETSAKASAGAEPDSGECEGVVPHWLRLGASGWRLDVADELPDSFIRGVRKAIKATKPDGMLIGEVWEDASNKTSYGERRKYFAGDELDGTMNYPLRSLLLDYINYTIGSGEAGRRFMSLAENYPRENLYGAMNLIGSHDRTRILTLMAADKDRGAAVSKVRLLSTLEYAFPGVPCIYYGDEAGLQGAADPENRSGFPWGEEDHDLQFHYRMLGLIYNEHPVLKDGDITMLSGNAGSNVKDIRQKNAGGDQKANVRIPDDVLAFIREYSPEQADDRCRACASTLTQNAAPADSAASTRERILVLVNRSYGKTEVDLSKDKRLRCGYAIDLFTSEELKMGSLSDEYDLADDTNGGSSSEKSVLPKMTLEPLSAKMILMLDEPPVKEDLGRSAGVICHVGSLGGQPLGKKARDFVDYIASAGFGIWQVLPVNPPGLGGSPYDSASAFAGDPELIDPEEMPDESGFDGFCEENAWWLHGYAAYCAIKEKLGGKALMEWPDEYRLADPEEAFQRAEKEAPETVSRIMHEQYWFAEEWRALKEYANGRGVRMMGDIPMYMSADSADVWASRKIFRMDDGGRLSVHAGVPPDYFSKDGQDWGNPLYDWDELKKEGYGWWLKRIRQCAARFDVLRIDHFRALSEYYAIPEGGRPSDGLWQHGPGSDLISSIKTMLAEEGLGMKLLAEDLGQLDAGVYDLLKLSGLPGMDIWQFSSYEMMAQTPDIARQRAFYTGTHDNDTLAGFVQEHAEEITGDNETVESAAKDIICKIYESPAVLAMVQLQDVFMLGSDARMNVPGVSDGNWKWRIPGESIKDSFADAEERAEWFRKLAEKTDRR